MKVKRYRAATMRDALEQIKGELGDEALVLGSREIRSNGFLGLGARNLVEVRVSTEFTNANQNPIRSEKNPAPRKSNITSLSLSENSPATPVLSSAQERNAASMSSALTARANSTEPARAPLAKSPESNPVAPSGTASKTISSEPASNLAPNRDSLVAELARLRAEVREVKFTLTRPSQNNSDTVAGAQALQDFTDADSEIYDSPFYETYLHLASLGLKPEMCRAAVRAAIASGTDSRDVGELAQAGLVKMLPSFIKFGDLSTPAADPASSHSVIALVGPTGVGKTTTIAKLAARVALRERRRVELITLDTYRIAAVDQLRTYAEIIGAGFHVPRSVLELDALIQRFAGEATVLIDTIGRSARDLADQLELADYLRANDDIIKCLVIQASTHPTDALLAVSKFALFGANRLVITKLDETGRPGAAISAAAASDLPLVYLCSGQRVPEDIEKATPQSLAGHALNSNALAIAA